MSHSNRFLILGNYARHGISKVSAERTRRITEVLKEMGGLLHEAYATLGKYDIFLIVELPGNNDALKLAAILQSSLGLTTSTFPAFPIEHFDQIAEALETEIESQRMAAGE